MTNPSAPESMKLRLAQWLAVFMLYVTAGKLGLMLATDNPSVTPVWAPTGIAVAALLLQGRWLWPAVFLGAFIVNVRAAGGGLRAVARDREGHHARGGPRGHAGAAVRGRPARLPRAAEHLRVRPP